jgi:murein DD-endopeptidase MepM/ murein hydrolase activator NlpD
MKKIFIFILLAFELFYTNAQPLEVQANYTSIGDVEFVAYNNTPAPLFLNINFADLQNTSFDEPLPYMKKLEPGFNTLFTLQRDLDAGAPQFNYDIKFFRSNPMAEINLDFPYLIPLNPGETTSVFDVKDIEGFWGSEEPDSWVATGFNVQPGQPVYASRTGTVVEIVGSSRTSKPEHWYHTWTNSVTVLQPDGTLICYRNLVDKNKKLEVNEKIYAGEQIGVVPPNADELILLIFQNSLNSEDLRFIIPQFVTGEDKTELLISSKEYKIAHPDKIRGLEMTRRERRKILK